MEKGLLKDKIEPIDLSQYKTPKINIIKSQNSRGVKQISIKSSMQKRNNIRIILGLDMSSSMNLTSSPPTSEKDKSSDESVNYSRYDLLKHLMNIESLNDSDKITIVTYSSDADILFDNEYLTDDKKREIKEKLNEISPSGGTNIWKGLQKCMECAGKPDDDGLMTSIYMLTDGEPTVRPPRGEKTMFDNLLNKYQEDNNKRYPVPVNFMGFGYKLEIELINWFTKNTHGNFNFIPDIGFMGTVIVNAIADIMSCWTSSLQVIIEPKEGFEIDSNFYSGFEKQNYGDWIEYNLGSANISFDKPLQFKILNKHTGQPSSSWDDCEFKVRYLNPYNYHMDTIDPLTTTDDADNKNLELNNIRLNCSDKIEKAFLKTCSNNFADATLIFGY